MVGLKNTSFSLRFWRNFILLGSFLIILINPLLNYYFNFNFIQGWYQSLGIGKLWFVSPLEGLESILVSKTVYLPLVIGMAIPILVSLFLGRVFCSWICPVTFLSESIERLWRFLSRRRIRDRLILPRRIFWFSLIIELLVTMVLGAPLFVFLSPPGLIGREIMRAVFFHRLGPEGLIVVLVILGNLLTRRLFCRYFCPLGALLAFLGSRRKLTIIQDHGTCKACSRCDQVCPLGLSPSQGEALSPYCWNCGKCLEACPRGSLTFRWGSKIPSPPAQIDNQLRDG
ncbi:4Fe-4S binding protein [Thermosulfuriphilus sp.]